MYSCVLVEELIFGLSLQEVYIQNKLPGTILQEEASLERLFWTRIQMGAESGAVTLAMERREHVFYKKWMK